MAGIECYTVVGAAVLGLAAWLVGGMQREKRHGFAVVALFLPVSRLYGRDPGAPFCNQSAFQV